MKYICWFISLFCGTVMVFAGEVEKPIYPLECELKIYPSTIHYGDIVFTSLAVKNSGSMKVCIDWDMRRRGYSQMSYSLWDSGMKEKYYQWKSENEFHSSEPHSNVSSCAAPIIPKTVALSPGETIPVAFRSLWIPPPEWRGKIFRNDYGTRFIRTQELKLRVDFLPHYDDYVTWSLEKNDWIPLNKQKLESNVVTYSNLPNQGYQPKVYTLEQPFHVLPRSNEIYELLRQWFLQIPGPSYAWTDGLLFPYCDDDPDSPHYLPYEDVSADSKRRIRSQESMIKKHAAFMEKISQRNEFMLERINRANELAEQLLKLPDEELSRNMKEFIQIRGFIVEMRFAENEETKARAFGELVKFVTASQDRDLWIHFVGEVALPSIEKYNHFSRAKEQEYRRRFTEIFNELKGK